MAEINYKKLADEKFGEWGDLFERHRIDADAVNLVRTTTKLLDADNHEIPHSVIVPLNDIATFVWRVETALNSAVEQVEVKSESKRFDTAYVEGFIRAAFKEADKLLTLKGMYPFNPFTDQQTFRRGSVATRCFFHIEKGELVPDITPWDTRYFVIDYDKKGIYYTAAKFIRSQSLILSEYPDAKVKEGDSEVLYIISRDTSEVWVDSAEVKTLPNKLGYVPVVYRRVPMGSMLQDKETIKFHGESGLFLIRDLFPEVERLASIIQSIHLKIIDQALQFRTPNQTPNSESGKTVDQVASPGTVNEIPENARFELMPLGQLAIAQADLLNRMIEDRLQRGMASRFQNILQPKTATEIMQIAQEQGEIILPRLGTRGLEKEDLAKMFIKQTIQSAEKAKVQTVKLDGTEWEVSKLKGDYSIEFKYSFKDPRMDAARQSMATSQRGLIPDRDIRINTLQREDWEADERQLRWEEDERLSPLVKLDRNIRGLLEDAKRGEPGAGRQAKMLIIQMIPALKQAMGGLMTPNMPEELKPAPPVLPLLNEGSPQGGQLNAG